MNPPKDLVSSADGWENEAENTLDLISKLYAPVVESQKLINYWEQ